MGKKFDLRVFMVILCCKPYFVIASPGYARVSLSDFTMDDFGQRTKSNTSSRFSMLP